MAWWLFQNLVVTAGLALAVAVVCRTSRIGPVGRHALWLVVLVKFVTPPLVVWPWAAPDPLRVSAFDVRADRGFDLAIPAVADVDAAASGDAASPVPTDLRGAAFATDARPADELAAVWPWLLGLWIAGSVVLLAVESARLVRLARRVRRSAPAVPALVQRIDSLAARLDLRPIEVRVVPGAAPPAVSCLGRPQLLWPAALPADVSDACVDGLLVHELAHVRRRDHLVGWLELAAGIVWWWNPLFWFVRSALREQSELACDAWVISALPNGRRAYAESLLALSGASGRGTSSMALVGIRATSRRVLERRLVMIMQGRAPLRLTRVGFLSLLLVAAATLPGWASASQNPPPPPPPPRPVAVEKPAPPPPPARVEVDAVVVQTLVPPKPVRVDIVRPKFENYIVRLNTDSLPEDGRKLLEGFETDRAAIEREAEQRIEARRQEMITSLEALQDQYTKAGKLDEAVAIRDFLRSRLAASGRFRYVLKRDGGGVR
jgi:beta-lactamase regulating signal transducer with metallopeptidase domain